MYMVEINGYNFPVFVTEDGTEFHPRQTATGSCWAIDWAEKPICSECNSGAGRHAGWCSKMKLNI